jgi:mersacidin/lichenicidin family type 2 lantibiotic
MAPRQSIRSWKDRQFRSRVSAAGRGGFANPPAGLMDLTEAEVEAATGGAGIGMGARGLLSDASPLDADASLATAGAPLL